MKPARAMHRFDHDLHPLACFKVSACICRLDIRRFCQVANARPACEIVGELHCYASHSTALLIQVQQSTMQIWLGLFTAGAQRTKSTRCEGALKLDLRKVSPTPLHLVVQRLDAHNKTITSETGDISFALHKASLPYKNNQYEWELTGSQADYHSSIVLKHGGVNEVAAVEQQDGTAVVTLQQGGFYTLNRFKWGSKTYRWTTSGCGDSRTHLQIKLMEDGSRQELARIEGPGSRCKSFWIQNPELSQDTISIFGRTDYPTWMQVVIASGMVAAKTQRRIDKSLQQQRM